MDLRRVRLPS